VVIFFRFIIYFSVFVILLVRSMCCVRATVRPFYYYIIFVAIETGNLIPHYNLLICIMPLNPAVQEYLDNVERYLSSVGGRAFFSDIGQPTRVPKPQGLPAGVALRDLCQNDGRFILHWDHSFSPPRVEISLARANILPPRDRNAIISEFLDNVESYVNGQGGRALFSDIGQESKVPRPVDFPVGVALRILCQQDPRFVLHWDQSFNPPRVEISLARQSSVAVGAPNVETTEDIIAAFLTRVEHFVTHAGGRVLFSAVGQIPRPEGIPADITLRELCQNDDRFTLLYDNAYHPPRVEILLNGGRPAPPPPLDRDAAIAEFLDNVERYVTQRGGRALFSDIGQSARVPRPPGFPVDVSLRILCNQDPRFEVVNDQAFTPPRAEILLVPRVHVVNPVAEATAQYANRVALYLEDNMERLTTVVQDNPVPELLVTAGCTARSILEEQPHRFRFRTSRGTQDDYVFVIDPESERPLGGADAEAVIAPGEVVEDFGSPADLLPPLPPVTNSWTPPGELQSVSVRSFRRDVEYNVYAPLELKNKDYVRRVLDITSEGMCTSVAHIMDKNQSYDIYYMLRDIVTSSTTFETAFGVHSAQFSQFMEAARNLLQARNMLMHMNFFGANNAASAARARELFVTAFQVLGAFDRYCQATGRPNQPQDATAMLIRLRMQYDWHLEWNAARYGAAAAAAADQSSDIDEEDVDPGGEEQEHEHSEDDQWEAAAVGIAAVTMAAQEDDENVANDNE
jgi:hypothetical protein